MNYHFFITQLRRTLMKKSLSKLAILATLAVLSSNAMAYKIYMDESDDYQMKYIGDCNDGSTFSVWKIKRGYYWWSGHHSKKGLQNLKTNDVDTAIRTLCGE